MAGTAEVKIPLTDEELHVVFTALLARMATTPHDNNAAAGRAAADIPSHPRE